MATRFYFIILEHCDSNTFLFLIIFKNDLFSIVNKIYITEKFSPVIHVEIFSEIDLNDCKM